MCASPIAVSSDGTASQLITVTINGTNDVPVLGGVHLGAVSEDNGAAGVAPLTPMTSGGLTIADLDQGPTNFPGPTGPTGSNNYRPLHLGSPPPRSPHTPQTHTTPPP